MSRSEKTLERVLLGTADANIRFDDLRLLLRNLGFEERVHGDHFIYSRAKIDEIINIQPRGRQAKPYQVKQVRSLILKYELAGSSESESEAESSSDPDLQNRSTSESTDGI